MSRVHGLNNATKPAGPGVARAMSGATAAEAQEILSLAAGIVALAAESTVGQSGVATSLGVSRKLVWNWMQADRPNVIDLVQILRADPRFAESVLSQALVYVRARIEDDEIPAEIGVERRARRLSVQHGRLIEAVEDALADGRIEQEEGARIIKAAREEQTRLSALVQEVAIAVGAR